MDMKRFFALLLCAAVALSLGSSAFAAPLNIGDAAAIRLDDILGSWVIYSYEIDGYFGYAADDGIWDELLFTPEGVVDYTDAGEWSGAEVYSDLPVLTMADGTLYFHVDEGEMSKDCFIVRAEGDELGISSEWLNPDGTPGGNYCVYRCAGAGERRLTAEELSALSDSVTVTEDGFFLSTYDRPEEIDWNEVFYNGAGVSVEATAEEIAQWESWYGELYTDLTVLPISAVEDFVWNMTATPYAFARKPLYPSWDQLDGETYCHAHGDTNYEDITFTDGTVDGDLYRLNYTRWDGRDYAGQREYVVTAYIRGGQWRFVSNLPADAPAPVTLLDIEFCESPEEAWSAEVILERVEFPVAETSEPYGWGWAVITAREDGVRYIIERVSTPYEYSSNAPIVPGLPISSGILYEGESIALYVNKPWYPEVRVTASMDTYWGSYVFGEDNWLHLDDGVLRYVTSHDLEGEGRGCSPANEAELARFLTDGTWVYYDPDSMELLATVEFPDFREMEITTVDAAYPVYLSCDRVYSEEGEAPDLLCMERGYFHETDWSALPSWYTFDSFGDYLISAVQLDGEQLLYLDQANNGDGALGYLFPKAGENAHSFTLVRYQGAADGESGAPIGETYDEPAPDYSWYYESFEPYYIEIPADTPIYDGPGYEYGVNGAVEEAGTFTIVEDYYDGGIWWGRLKSGVGWIVTDGLNYWWP